MSYDKDKFIQLVAMYVNPDLIYVKGDRNYKTPCGRGIRNLSDKEFREYVEHLVCDFLILEDYGLTKDLN